MPKLDVIKGSKRDMMGFFTGPFFIFPTALLEVVCVVIMHHDQCMQ